jgi:hypothetical protein
MTPFQHRRDPSINRIAQDMQTRNFATKTVERVDWGFEKWVAILNHCGPIKFSA